MKKLFYLLITAAIFTACGTDNKGYTVTGTVEGAADGDTIYLAVREGRKMVNLDTTVIKKGTFTFKGVQDTTKLCYLSYKAEGKKGLSMEFFLENGKINAALTKVNDSAVGTPSNDNYQPIRQKYNESFKKQIDLGTEIQKGEMTDEERAAKLKEYEAIENECVQILKDGIAQQISNIVGITLLKQNYYHMSVEELEPLIPQIPAEYDNDKTIQRIKENFTKMKATAVGQQFTDFEMKDLKGKNVKLSDYVGKGKVVLVDFWASWCGPCRREMPNLVEAYKQYKGKNFEIVGVSLDRDEAAWKNMSKELKITWPQMSDLKFWQCEGAQLYAVSSIPHTVLIDGNGTIIARGLHGKALLDKIAEVVK